MSEGDALSVGAVASALYEQELVQRIRQAPVLKPRRVRCVGCGQSVRTRRSGAVPVWHRDPLRRRKWCTGSPGQAGGRG